jgi:hypothetical protein
VPQAVDPKVKWQCVPNESLISFAEAKRLPVYPMLLAQFIGIVHEIKPEFVNAPAPDGFGRTTHLPPTLISLGRFSGNSRKIVDAYVARGITVCIAESFDVRLAVHRKKGTRSPLYWDPTTDTESLSNSLKDAESPDDESSSRKEDPEKRFEGEKITI